MAKDSLKAPSPRRFKHVSWHPTSGRWVAQRKGCASPGCAKTQLAAAKLASSAWGISLGHLRLKMRPARRKRKTSKFAYVYWHAPRAIWYAQARRIFLGGASARSTRRRRNCYGEASPNRTRSSSWPSVLKLGGTRGKRLRRRRGPPRHPRQHPRLHHPWLPPHALSVSIRSWTYGTSTAPRIPPKGSVYLATSRTA